MFTLFLEPVHPRSRGEHSRAANSSRSQPGSSPLSRGTLHQDQGTPDKTRFIPALAGNTRPPSLPAAQTAVHPRSRGEHRTPARGLPSAPGSSPLSRGTQERLARRDLFQRFIPALAGNTPGTSPATRQTAVHPRSRGEHLSAVSRVNSRAGSSPLSRGTQVMQAGNRVFSRFIPALAGNTPRR